MYVSSRGLPGVQATSQRCLSSWARGSTRLPWRALKPLQVSQTPAPDSCPGSRPAGTPPVALRGGRWSARRQTGGRVGRQALRGSGWERGALWFISPPDKRRKRLLQFQEGRELSRNMVSWKRAWVHFVSSAGWGGTPRTFLPIPLVELVNGIAVLLLRRRCTLSDFEIGLIGFFARRNASTSSKSLLCMLS